MPSISGVGSASFLCNHVFFVLGLALTPCLIVGLALTPCLTMGLALIPCFVMGLALIPYAEAGFLFVYQEKN